MRILVLCVLVFLPFAADSAERGADLAARYQALRPQLEHNDIGAPVVIASHEEGGQRSGDVHGLLAFSFSVVAETLRSPRAWCDVMLLHLNIKACAHEHRSDGDWLNLYSGRKFYEPPEKAYQLRYAFKIVADRADYLAVTLDAATGPLGTQDYRIAIEAIPQNGATFLHFSYAYRPSLLSRAATGSYLATFGSGKIGFTVTGRNSDGKTEHVGGVRGIVERNAMRYYLAVQAYLETPGSSLAVFEQRLARWYTLTERFAPQLHEIDWVEYLDAKRREHNHQFEVQRTFDTATPGTQ